MKKNKKAFLLALTVACLTFVVYIPSLWNGFAGVWDDRNYVIDNPYIRTLDFSFFKWASVSVVNSTWHPLTMFSYALDYRFWKLNPFGYHLTNIIFHSANTFLAFIVAANLAIKAQLAGKSGLKEGMTRKALAVGLITALLFGLHPLHVESVSWISERKDVLSAFFFFAAVLVYLRWVESGSILLYVLTLLLYVFALLSKPMAISLPVVLIIIDYYPLRRLDKARSLASKIPFLLLGAVSAWVTIVSHEGQAIMPLIRHPLSARIMVAVRAYVFYLYKMALPIDLAPFYPMPDKITPFSIEFILSFLIFGAITAYCLFNGGKRRFLLAAWAYYLVTLLPVIGLMQVGMQAAADRYAYLPSMGPFILIGAGFAHLMEK